MVSSPDDLFSATLGSSWSGGAAEDGTQHGSPSILLSLTPALNDPDTPLRELPLRAYSIPASINTPPASYRFAGGSIDEWLKHGEIRNPNGLHVAGEKLIIGNNGDHCLKAVDLDTKNITTIANLGPGIIDGIQSDTQGNLIVSHWEGKIYRVSPNGEVTKILDLSVPKTNTADFAYLEERGLIVIPTFTSNRVLAYQFMENRPD